MNETVNVAISNFSIVEMLVFGILLFIVLRLVRRSLRKFSSGKAVRTALARTWPLAETVIWTVFGLTALTSIFDNRTMYAVGLMLLLSAASGWFFWFVGRDWVAGVVLKFRNAVQPGQAIRISGVSGTVRRIGDLSLEVEEEDGTIAEIPYSIVQSEIRWKIAAEQSGSIHRFEVNLPRGNSIAESMQHVRRLVLQSPWCSSRREPQIKLVSETDETLSFEVQLTAIEQRFARAVERDVLKKIEA